MHCHTKEGSMDAFVPINEIVEGLKVKNFDGLLVTDHNSYKGFNSYKALNKENFTVLKGIEYDTFDAGHFIIILPNNVNESIFENRGLKLNELCNLVHKLNGVVGAAHPFDHGRLGMMKLRKWKNLCNLRKVIKDIDFIETFNSSASTLSNDLARIFALKHNKPGTGGSDCHRKNSIGIGKTIFGVDILDNNDLISAIKSSQILEAGGQEVQKHFRKLKHRLFTYMTCPYFYASKILCLKKRHNLLERLAELDA